MVVHVNDLVEVTKQIIDQYSACRIFILRGEMGAGKTTLSKAFCSHFGINEEVNSPTFAIANIYTSESVGEIYHFDFYRLNTSQEALDIGFEDYVYSGNYCLIEWPNLVEHYIPRPFVEVEIRHIDKKTEREVTCKLIE